MKYFLLGAANF